jgi:transposase
MLNPALPETLAECHAFLQAMAQVHAQQQATMTKQQALIEQQQATIARQQATIETQQAALASLTKDVALLKRSLFGPRQERFLDPHQRLLFDAVALGESAGESQDETSQDDEEEPGGSSSPSRRKGRVRRVIPECLPRIQRFHELKDEDIPKEQRGQAGRRFYKKTSEWVEWEAPKLYVVEEYVEVLAIDNPDATETVMISAPKAPRILSCFVGPRMLASFAAGHFADHQPYYRLEEILLRSGLQIDRGTICRWMIRVAMELKPLIDLMRRLALLSAVAQADETPVKMLVPGQGQTSLVYLWAVLGDSRHPFTTFYFMPDRSRAGPDQIFADFEGVLLSDAYVCYELMRDDSNGRIRLAGCHAHARRKFEELHHLGPTERTATALGYFQRLFLIEEELKDLSSEERHAERQRRSRPLLSEFKTWMDQQLESLTPKHDLRGAIEYMTTRWESFERFLESGDIPLSNNASEQAVKVAVMGRKAWLFFGSPEGGEAAAIFYTLTATCRRLRIDPLAYLSDLFERWPTCDPQDESSLAAFLPDRWLASHPEAKLAMREKESKQKAAKKLARHSHLRAALAKAERQGL